MTDKDIIRSLAICGDASVECEGCSYNEVKFCHFCLKSDALGLINQQRAEIERLKKYNTDVAYKHYNDGIKEFAQQVKMAFYYEFDELIPSIMADIIDNLVKEMVGADNG